MFKMLLILFPFCALLHCWGRWGEVPYCTDSNGCNIAEPYVIRRWMAKIPDSTKINQLSLPGTHDSMARFGGGNVQCQSMSLRRQLEVGIRAFDIRNRRTGDSFAIHHGAFFQHAFFGSDVAQVMSQFLVENPTETIIMHHQQEYTAQSGSQSYDSIMNRYLGIYNKLWKLGSNTKAQQLTLGEARGKILIDWDVRNNREYQNRWNIDSCSKLDSKKRALINNINNARNNPHGNKLYINYLSGHDMGKGTLSCFKFWSCGCLSIRTIARTCNQLAFETLKKFTTTKRVGMIMSDYPGPNLISEIIRQNYFKCPTYREKSFSSSGVAQSCQTHIRLLRSGDKIALRSNCAKKGWVGCWKNAGSKCKPASCPGGMFWKNDVDKCFGEQFVIVAEGKERGAIIYAGDKVGLYYRDDHWLSCEDVGKDCITRPCPGRLLDKYNSGWDWNDGCAWETFQIEKAGTRGRVKLYPHDEVMFRRTSRSCDNRFLSEEGNRIKLRTCPGCVHRFGKTWHYRTCSCERFDFEILRWTS